MGGVRPSSANVLAGLGVQVGLEGTAAIAAARFTDIDLWQQVRFVAPDMLLGAELMLPVALAATLIMLPSYSNWQMPSAEEMAQRAEMAAKLRRKPEGGAAAKPGTGAAETRAPPAAEAPSTSLNATDEAAFPVSPARMDAAPPSPAPTADAGSKPQQAESKSPLLPDGVIPITQWGAKPTAAGGLPKPKPEGPFERFRAVMHLAQGQAVANNPTSRVPFAAEVGFILLEGASNTLLYRGVVFTLMAQWLADRLFEAGGEDFVSSLAPALAQLSVDDVGKWSAVGLTALIAILLTAQRIASARRRWQLLRESFQRQISQSVKGSKAGMTFDMMDRPFDAASWSAVVTSSYDVMATTALNSAYVLTGNLAAAYAGAVVHQLVFSVLQRYNEERMRKKGEAIAKVRATACFTVFVTERLCAQAFGTALTDSIAGRVLAAFGKTNNRTFC